jgi:sugar phosphate isomerase/epimerase
MMKIIRKVHVSAPYELLMKNYLDRFIKDAINPEIGLDAAVLDRHSADDFLQTAKILHSRNLSVTFHGPFNDLSPGSPDPMAWNMTKKRYEQVLRLVPIFKPKTLVCHAGYDWKRYSYFREEWVEKSIEMWSWLSQRLADEGTLLTLENVFEHGPEDIEIIFQNLAGKNVGFCFDIGHQSAFSRTSFELWIKVLGPYLAQLHIHDNDSTRDQHKGLGRASIDFPSFFKLLKNIRSTPPVVTLEPHQEEDIIPSLEYLENVWPW